VSKTKFTSGIHRQWDKAHNPIDHDCLSDIQNLTLIVVIWLNS